MTLLEVQSLYKKYGKVSALENISFILEKGKALGIVGESGSGKSTLIKSILGIEKASSGQVIFDGQVLNDLKKKEKRSLYKEIQIVMQDPSSSLNPKLPVWKSMVEPISNFPDRKKAIYHHLSLFEVAKQLAKRVGLNEEHLLRFPHELSGGQKQRISIARGISLHPQLLILDEPTSSLDVSIQAQILTLLNNLQQELDTTYLFVSHDLAAVRFLCDEVIVLKEGKLVECFQSDKILEQNRHDYTKELIHYAVY